MIDTDIKGLTPQFAVSPLCVSRGHISGPWPWAEQVGATLAAEADGPLQGLAEALQRSGSHRRDEAGQGCDSGERLDPFVTGLQKFFNSKLVFVFLVAKLLLKKLFDNDFPAKMQPVLKKYKA